MAELVSEIAEIEHALLDCTSYSAIGAKALMQCSGVNSFNNRGRACQQRLRNWTNAEMIPAPEDWAQDRSSYERSNEFKNRSLNVMPRSVKSTNNSSGTR